MGRSEEFDGDSLGVERVVVVEKMWENLWVSLWESCGKVLHILEMGEFYTKIVAKVVVFHGVVEKLYIVFYTLNNRGSSRVLHSFHSPYYYYY